MKKEIHAVSSKMLFLILPLEGQMSYIISQTLAVLLLNVCSKWPLHIKFRKIEQF